MSVYRDSVSSKSGQWVKQGSSTERASVEIGFVTGFAFF